MKKMKLFILKLNLFLIENNDDDSLEQQIKDKISK
jgi:hypothetical protein